MKKIMILSPKYFLTLKEPDSQHLFPYDLACVRQENTMMVSQSGTRGNLGSPAIIYCFFLVVVVVEVASVGTYDYRFSIMCSACFAKAVCMQSIEI